MIPVHSFNQDFDQMYFGQLLDTTLEAKEVAEDADISEVAQYYLFL
jgi:hypothetical protein